MSGEVVGAFGPILLILALGAAWWLGRRGPVVVDRVRPPIRPRRPARLSDDYAVWSTAYDEEVEALALMDGHLGAARERRAALTERHAGLMADLYQVSDDIARGLRGRDTAATLLVDMSGSLRGEPAEIAFLLARSFGRFCAAAGIPCEVLGFTTVDWRGLPVRRDWISAGRPSDPGRLCALRHVVLADGRDEDGLAALLSTDLLRENVDGEAILWATDRLLRRGARKKALIVLSDGAPVDDSTLAANHPAILEDHLKDVLRRLAVIGDVEVGAIGLSFDVSRYYDRYVTISDPGEIAEVVLPFLAETLR